MDDLDRRILAVTAAHGRVSLQHLAATVQLGASATRERLRKLEQRGVITAYRATIDETALGYPLQALVEVDLAPGADLAASPGTPTPTTIDTSLRLDGVACPTTTQCTAVS